MDGDAQRMALEALMAETGATFAQLSQLLGRNPAYLQQFVRRGTPRQLAERDRALLAAYFGVPESRLGGPEADWVSVPRLDVGASAGFGRLVEMEAQRRPGAFDPALLRQLGVAPENASMIEVAGDSMSPTLEDGDGILVDRAQRSIGQRGGIFVLRLDGELMVKRLRRGVGGIQVISDNPSYPPRAPPAEAIEVVGRVVWLSRSL